MTSPEAGPPGAGPTRKGTGTRCVLIALFWAWLAGAAMILSDPLFSEDFGQRAALLVVIAVILGVAWGILSLARGPTVLRSRGMRWAWWTAPASLLIAVALWATNVAVSARVWMCEAELRRIVEAFPGESANSPRTTFPPRVGLFHVQAMFAIGPDTHIVTGNGFFCTVGVAHRPEGGALETLEGKRRVRYQHLFGPWYQFKLTHTGPLF